MQMALLVVNHGTIAGAIPRPDALEPPGRVRQASPGSGTVAALERGPTGTRIPLVLLEPGIRAVAGERRETGVDAVEQTGAGIGTVADQRQPRQRGARHLQLAHVLRPVLTPASPDETAERYLDWIGLLKSCTAFEAYCKVYTADVRPDRIAEFLILNPEFPHSIRFAADRLHAALEAVAQSTESKRARRVNRLAGRLRASLDYGQIDEIIGSGLFAYLDDVQKQCKQIHDTIYQTYITYPIEELVS